MMELILDRLVAAGGPPPGHRRLPAVDELVLTILSQNTSDLNRDRAHTAMRARFPSWEDVRDADPAVLADVLRPGGLADQKAPRIQAVLGRISADGPPELEWLGELEPADALAWLDDLPGVGMKTASCVLLFSFGVPVMPVDTHVHRVAGRLGLIPPGTSADRAHDLMTAATPPARMLEAHLLLIRHGRTICAARRPHCEGCPLLDLCPCGRADQDLL
ncbi:MAG: endonuclease III [Gaiellales bacterium]